jgi:pimeloyl-ACP methyl ester carboxylesterase
MTATIQSQLDRGLVRQYSWNWQGQNFFVVSETISQIAQPKNSLLLLPAFSTVSTRGEMAQLAQFLSSQAKVILLDWLGFGDSERPALNYQPKIYHQLLQDFVKTLDDRSQIIIAAGHTAGYALELAKILPERIAKVILIAPTWRGPLPTMGASPRLASWVRNLVRSPLLGQFLYFLNTRPSFLRWMYRRHVYLNSELLTPELLKIKYENTQKTGSRYAPAAFVTGGLDPYGDRQSFLEAIANCPVEVIAILAEQAPPKSKAEMNAISSIAGVKTFTLPGTLGMHEEFAQIVGETILSYCQ